MTSFAPAVKAQLKARVALCGPTGSGKTWTALEWATVLAEGGKVALIDTERDSARLYASHFTFDVARFDPPFEVHRLVAMLHEAADAGYACVVVDSLSHFWEGEGGVLDEVDAAAARSHGNTFAGWKHGTPVQRHMVDTFLALPCHVVITMRSKMEYVLETNAQGKQVPRKVGMAPVQRAGVEYEFTVVGDLDLEHRITITKSRCDVLADLVVQPNRAPEAAAQFLDWLNDGEPPPPLATPEAIAEHAAAVKAAGPGVLASMKAWAGATGFDLRRHPTVAQLDAANAHLAEVVATGDGATREEPIGAHADSFVSGPDPSAGEDAASSPTGADAPESVPSSSPDALPPVSDAEAALAAHPCDLCGSTRTKCTTVGGTVRCQDAKGCAKRVEEKAHACAGCGDQLSGNWIEADDGYNYHEDCKPW